MNGQLFGHVQGDVVFLARWAILIFKYSNEIGVFRKYILSDAPPVLFDKIIVKSVSSVNPFGFDKVIKPNNINTFSENFRTLFAQ